MTLWKHEKKVGHVPGQPTRTVKREWVCLWRWNSWIVGVRCKRYGRMIHENYGTKDQHFALHLLCLSFHYQNHTSYGIHAFMARGGV